MTAKAEGDGAALPLAAAAGGAFVLWPDTHPPVPPRTPPSTVAAPFIAAEGPRAAPVRAATADAPKRERARTAAAPATPAALGTLLVRPLRARPFGRGRDHDDRQPRRRRLPESTPRGPAPIRPGPRASRGSPPAASASRAIGPTTARPSRFAPGIRPSSTSRSRSDSTSPESSSTRAARRWPTRSSRSRRSQRPIVMPRSSRPRTRRGASSSEMRRSTA